MKRRAFLAGTAGLAGAGSRTVPVQARVPGPTTAHWRWSCPAGNIDVALTPAGVTVTAGEAGAAPLAGGPLAALGADLRPVTWQPVAWREPDALHRHLLLQSADAGLAAEVFLACDGSTGLISQRTTLTHRGDGESDIRATCAFSFEVGDPVDRILYLTGGWTEEAEIRRANPGDGSLTLESRSGKTGFQFQPYVALRTGAETYLCQILWSGNWTLQVEPHKSGVLLSGGLNNWRFRHRLRDGQSLALPTVLFGRVRENLNGATQRLHDHHRARRPDPERPIPVQFNSWYPYLGEPTAEVLVPLIPTVKRLGCEVFVVDAGWYRNDEGETDADWMQRTGDWRTSRRRFPRGLREVAAACHDQGLLFGLWFEPEVISSSSSIRREHPDWLHHVDGKEAPAKERAVLNLGVPGAWQHVFERLARMLGLIGIDWMKWDFNADISSGGWAPGLPGELTRMDPLVAHYEGLYRLQDALRASFPDLVLEMCASGGGRLDGAILSHAHVNWMSDQAAALRKLAMHFGTQLAYPAVTCNDWLIDWPGSENEGVEPASLTDWHGDLPFRLRVAMLGTFGISAPIDRWSRSDIATAARHVELYKTRLRPLIHHGDQYYLTRAPRPDGSSDWAAIWYVAKDGHSGVLFAFRLSSANGARRFFLPGLEADRAYRVTFASGPTRVARGAELDAGLAVEIGDTFRSELCLVEIVA